MRLLPALKVSVALRAGTEEKHSRSILSLLLPSACWGEGQLLLYLNEAAPALSLEGAEASVHLAGRKEKDQTWRCESEGTNAQGWASSQARSGAGKGGRSVFDAELWMQKWPSIVESHQRSSCWGSKPAPC